MRYVPRPLLHAELVDPYAEEISLDQVTMTNTWATIQTGCITAKNQSHQSVPLNGTNLSSSVATNSLLRAYVGIDNATAGVRYEVRFVRVNPLTGAILATYGWYVRQVKGTGFKQAEWFYSSIQNLPAGEHRIDLQARVIDSGTITVGTRWMTLQGAPSDGVAPGGRARFPSGIAVTSPSYTITGSWSPSVTSTLSFENSVEVNLFAQAYFEINGGTPGDQISVGFQLDNESPSRRTSDFAVPQTFAGYATRDGVNIADHLENVAAVPLTVPAGKHTLKLWAVSRSGRPVTVSNRAIEFATFPTNNTSLGAQFVQWASTPGRRLTINSTAASSTPPKGWIGTGGGGFGYWQPITDEFEMPPDVAGGSYQWVGQGFIETLGRAGNWTDGTVEIAIDTYHYPPGSSTPTTVDFGWVPVHMNVDRGHIYMFSDAFHWGNAYGNKMRIYMRKVIPASGATFDIGKVYFAMQLVPSDGGQCYYRSCDPNTPGNCY